MNVTGILFHSNGYVVVAVQQVAACNHAFLLWSILLTD